MADLRRLRSETITRLDSFFPKWVVMGGLVTHITYTCLSPVMGVYIGLERHVRAMNPCLSLCRYVKST